MTFAVLFVLLLVNTCSASASYSHDGSVAFDVFTQQEPYSGRGPNMPSDAFGPGDLVILYALLTLNGSPVNNILVAFDVKMPSNASLDFSARTNVSGVAMVHFRIPYPSLNVSESEIFGVWMVTGSTLYGGKVYQDTLPFKVDWIVKLLSVETTGENLTSQSTFGRGGDVGLVITLRSIAMTLKNATIGIVVKDELDVPVNNSEIQDFIVPPNEEVVTVYCKATLAPSAFVGPNATVTVSAFKTSANGTLIPYCPSILTSFSITTEEPIEIDYHDAAVVVVLPSARTIGLGQSLTLETIVRTEGTVAESFNVSTYFDEVLLGPPSEVTNLSPYSAMIFNYSVDSSLLTVGNHTISAYIPPVPQECNLTDNYFSSWVEVTPIPPVVHDVGIASIGLSTNSVYVGGVVNIYVTVKNNGTQTESNCTVSTYYNSSLIENIQVTLTPGSQAPVTFSWNTSSVSAGLYQISAYAALPDNETNPSGTNGRGLTDGFVQVITPFSPSLVFVVFIASMFGLVIIAGLILLLMLGFLRRRRKKKPGRYVVVVHLHI